MCIRDRSYADTNASIMTAEFGQWFCLYSSSTCDRIQNARKCRLILWLRIQGPGNPRIPPAPSSHN
eukprot:1460442-Amphidinium_carterae.1